MATIDNMRVLFGQGSSATFATELKEPNKLYFLQDTQEMYLGNVRYAFGRDISIQITGSGDTVANVLWDSAAKALTIVLGDAGDARSVTEAIETAFAACVKHIYSERGSSILVDDSDKDNVKLSLNLASGSLAGNVRLEECSDGLRGYVDLPEVPVTGVQANDKVLALEGSLLTSTLSITTEAGTDGKQYVILKGIGGVEISKFDASDFVAAGMLQSVTLEDRAVGSEIHKFLVMTFIVAGGSTSSVAVDLEDLIDVYTAKANGGLKLENNAFSIVNEVIPNYGVNTDKTIQFNSVVTLNTIMYDAHGSITGTKEITFRIPGLSGSVGNSGSNSTLLTYVSMSDTGELSGEYMNVVTSIGAASTHAQIATAKAVYDAVEDATAKWERF